MAEHPVNLFEFDVGDPEKKESKDGGSKLGFWVYHIRTKTTLDQYERSDMLTSRRYNDFVWLREALVEAHPGVIVPPIPEKNFKGAVEKIGLLSVDATNLLEYRCRALRKFLVRTGAHPILCTSKLLQYFLEDTEAQFQQRRNGPQKGAEMEAGARRVTEKASVGQKFSEMKFSLTRKGAHPDDPQEEEPSAARGDTAEAWRETLVYVTTLENSLTVMKERIEALVKKRTESTTSMVDFGKGLHKLGELEEGRAGPLSKALEEVGTQTEHLALQYTEQGENETIQVVETFLYYIGMCQAVRLVVRRIEQLTLTRDTIKHEKALLAQKRRQLQGQAGKEEILRKLDVETANVGDRLERAEADLTSVEDTFREELVRFHREKQYDMKQLLKAFVDLQLEASAKMLSSWQQILPAVQGVPKPAPPE
eukprot:NODE_1546_length_1378_cov_10.317532_g1284_i0.p1 GENE.NODE_1546_length_1378_cov_10.317532_g1284_i0~~NODE_1546_length_1378_cov_10.317532_g1284_i0.p1  ORF type:complete len:423 (+),score=114.18 NODE_1546_length_1378_cov_10.317532_g1284_i0:51-1319(+)